MNTEQLERMKSGQGFVAALDQSGGSTPKALKLYGIEENAYSNNEEMFALVHEMRKRIIKNSAFNSSRILAAILFQATMDSKIDDLYTADYLWQKKGIVPILKVDEGLAELKNGVQVMKEMKGLDSLLVKAEERSIFGTKMRSVIKQFSVSGIAALVEQQFKYAREISNAGFVPIIEPEVDINAENKAKIESVLKQEIIGQLQNLPENCFIMFKFTLPDVDNLYEDLYLYPQVIRIVALSGGYSREKANALLAKNRNIIASFSRALTEGLNVNQSEEEFTKTIDTSIQTIFASSIT